MEKEYGNNAQKRENALKTAHTLRIDRRRHTEITGVEDVCSYDDKEIVVKLESGYMILSGENMHICKLLPDEGRLEADGSIDSIVYEKPHKIAGFRLPFFHRKK